MNEEPSKTCEFIDTNAARMMVYQDLRGQIISLVELRQRLVEMNLTLAAALIAAAVAYPTKPSIAFVYPPIAALIAIAWSPRNDIIRDLCNYIKDNIECSMEICGWSTYLAKKGGITGKNLIVLSYGGMFIAAQLLAIIVGMIQMDDPDAIVQSNSLIELMKHINYMSLIVVFYLIYKGITNASPTC